MSEWNKGAPPNIGWWPASILRDKTSIRWWDGKCWSWSAHCGYGAELASRYAAHPASPSENKEVEWTGRWWQRNRQERQ